MKRGVRVAECQLPLRLRLLPPLPPVFLQNKARREDFCPRKLRQMHLVIDQLMAHSHLRYKGEGPLAAPEPARGRLAPDPVPWPLPQTWEGGQTRSPDLNLTTQRRPPSPPPGLAPRCLQPLTGSLHQVLYPCCSAMSSPGSRLTSWTLRSTCF